jgi:hypothetical protein
MKVTLNPDGSLDFDVDTVEEAVALARTIQHNGNGSAPATKKIRSAPVPQSEMIPVSPQLLSTWQYLVDHGSSSGTAATEVAAGQGLKLPTATYRLNHLIKAGLAHRVSPGFYAPGEAQEDEVS